METVSYLDRLLEPLADAMTPEVARRVVDIRLDSEMQAELESLRAGANEGSLTPEQERRYKRLVEALDTLAVIQLKARRALADHAA
jgi:hypothetical protein